MTRTTAAALTACTLTLAVAGPTRPAHAQLIVPGASQEAGDGGLGLTVKGEGSAAARPNRLEIEVEVSAASELTADAIVKYRDARRRLHEAFDALKLENVKVEERGLLVDEKGVQMNPYSFDGMPNRRTKPEVQLTRKLVVTLSGIREMDEEALLRLVAKLMDVAQDAGGKLGPGGPQVNPYYYNPYMQGGGGLVKFVLDDYEALEEQAYEKAFADAATKAARLAKLGKFTLGPVTGVRVAVSPGEKPPSTSPRFDTGQAEEPPPAGRRIESSKFEDVPVRVALSVHYAVGGPPVEGRAGGQ